MHFGAYLLDVERFMRIFWARSAPLLDPFLTHSVRTWFGLPGASAEGAAAQAALSAFGGQLHAICALSGWRTGRCGNPGLDYPNDETWATFISIDQS
jgi:hypothetical protein